MITALTAPTTTPADVLRATGDWLRSHPKVRYTLLFFAVCTVCYFLNISSAAATDTETESRAFDLPLVGITDTHGVPIWRYLELPLDPGNGFAASSEGMPRQIRYMIASILWAFYALPILLMIALVEWIVSFEWLSWIAAPFETVAEGVSGVMEAWMIVSLGVAISALWIGIGFLRGRTGAALVEFVMVVIVFGFIASPWADPFTWMTGGGSDTASESGFIRQAADAGAEAGGMTINQEADPDNVTLAGSIVDITLRQPALNMAFGSSLSGDCEDAWNNAAAADSDLHGDEIREEVIECSDAVAAANQTNSFVWMFDYLMAWPVAIGVNFLLGVFLFFLIWQVIQAFISAVATILRGFLALFPGNSRTAWLNSLFQVVVSGVLIGVYIFLLTVYMWGMGMLIDALPAPLMRVGALLLGLLILIAAFTFWKIKKSGQSVAERLSKALGKTGLSKDAPDKKPSNFGTTTKNLTKSAVSKGIDMRNNARLLRATKTGVTMAAGAATGGVGAAAAKAGTSMATGMATKAATKVATPGANLPGVKGALPGAAQGPKPSLPSGNTPAGELPTGSESPASAPSGIQPVASIAPPAGSENAASSPLPQQNGEVLHGEVTNGGGVPPTVTGAQRVKADSSSEPSLSGTGTPMGGVPAQERPKNRLNNIPPGSYGRNHVHKNGQVHQPLTIEPDGTPVRNIPSEEKISRATESADGWILPGAKNLKPSSRTPATEQPASPAQSSERMQKQDDQRPKPKPMQQRPSDSETTRHRPRPELVDVAARADQANQASVEAPQQPTERPTPRPMKNRRGEL